MSGCCWPHWELPAGPSPRTESSPSNAPGNTNKKRTWERRLSELLLFFVFKGRRNPHEHPSLLVFNSPCVLRYSWGRRRQRNHPHPHRLRFYRSLKKRPSWAHVLHFFFSRTTYIYTALGHFLLIFFCGNRPFIVPLTVCYRPPSIGN